MALSKKELYAEVQNICDTFGIEGEAREKLVALVEPKRAGIKFDIDEIACKDENDVVTYILDSVFQKWIPIYDDEGEPNFYEKPDTELGWSRFSRAAEKARKTAEKTYKATKDAVLTDLLNDRSTQEEAKAIMEQAEAGRKSLEIPADLVASDEKPCA